MQPDSTVLNQLVELVNNTQPRNVLITAAYATIIGAALSTILTGFIIYLTIKDKQKAKSLNELEKQTESLQNSFIELIKPIWSVIKFETASSAHFKFTIQNIGGGCKNFTLTPIDTGFYIKDLTTINGQNYGSHSYFECFIQHSPTDLIKTFELDKKYAISCEFEDIEGRKYRQTLVIMKILASPRNRIYLSSPERIS